MGTRVKIIKLLEQETKILTGQYERVVAQFGSALDWGQGVAGSNPVNPTSLTAGQRLIVSDLFYLCPRDCEKWHGNFADALNPKLFRGLKK